MQDAGVILGLPLEGLPITGIIDSDNWNTLVEQHVRIRSSEAEGAGPSKKSGAVSSTWLRQHFSYCPPGAPEQVVERLKNILYVKKNDYT